MNNNIKIIRYLDGDLPENEKVLFEEELAKSKTLQDELAGYKKVFNKIDEQKDINVENIYFNNLITSIKSKLEKNITINPFRKYGYAFVIVVLLTAGYFISQPMFNSSSNKIVTVEEFVENLDEKDIGELANYLSSDNYSDNGDENIYNVDENLDDIILSSTNDNKIAILSDYEINNLYASLSESEQTKIYNDLINKTFTSEVNL